MNRQRMYPALALAVAAAALMAFTSTAWASVLTSPTGTAGTPEVTATSEGHVAIDLPGLPSIECSSTLDGQVMSHGKGKPVESALTIVTFTGCTNSWHVTVAVRGQLSIDGGIGYNGTVSWTGATIEATRLGTTCRFITNKTYVGLLKGGSPATIELSGNLLFHSGGALCGTGPFPVTGSYQVTSPSSLFVDGDPVEGEAGTAITSPTGTVATPAIEAISEGTVAIDVAPLPNIACSSTIKAQIEGHGDGVPAAGHLSALTFTSCGEGWHVTALLPGSLEIDWTSGYNGTLVSSGATIEATTSGLICRYATNNTTIGTITGGSPATIDLAGSIPLHSGSSFLCGKGPFALTGSYELTSPGSLYVDEAPLEVGITSPTGTTATPTIKAESEGHVSLDHPIAKLQCQWAFEGSVKSHGNGEGALVPLTSLSTTGCTDSWHVTTTTAGELKIASAGGYNGTVTWSGGTVEMTRLGTTCRYKTENTHLGTLTGGSPATVDMEAKLPFHGGSALCGEEAYSLTGSFKLASPGALYVDRAA